MRASPLIAGVVALALGSSAAAQILVIPRTAGKSHVVYFDFLWRYIDLTSGPPAERAAEFTGAKTGTIRLYFYEREREVAERASAIVLDSFRYLEDAFHFVPPERIPLILYSSYQEFLETNLFPLQEGTLGVTSPTNLTMTLPYFGDDRLFERVHTHEMAHQFTIQKLRSVTKRQDRFGDPMEALPLWFIEGLAEFYALRGIDPEAEMLIRDLVANPDVEHDFGLHDFFDEYPLTVLWIYKGGNVRCAFLEDTYGKGTIQRILEASPRLVRGREPVRFKGFKGLLKYVTGDDAEVVSQKFEQWIKRRAYQSYLRSEPDTVATVLEHFDQNVESIRASPDGNLLVMRGFDTETGVSKLMLINWHAPQRIITIARDGTPGLESLHPLSGRSFDINQNSIVFVGEAGGRDVIFWQTYSHRAKQVAFPEMQMYEFDRRLNPLDPRQNLPFQAWEVDISLGDRKSYSLGTKGLIAAFSPSISPDGKRVAFIGLNELGTRDVYVLNPGGPAGFSLTQITHDEYSERELFWGPNGIVYTSDATSHGKYNLFRAWPDRVALPERLTTEPRDEFDLQVLPNGRTFFVAYDDAHANIYELMSDKLVRRSEMSTGLLMPSTGHDNGLWALLQKGGKRQPVFIAQSKLLSEEVPVQPDAQPPQPLSQVDINRDEPYRFTSARQWELNPIFALAGGGTGGIYGQLFGSATDKLRNHVLFVDFAVYGNFNLINGDLLYIDQGQRLIWGGGLFHSLRFRYDTTFADRFGTFLSYERFYGVLGSLRYPFSRFSYFQSDLAVGGSSAFLDPTVAATLQDPVLTQAGDLLTPWQQRYGGTYFQTEVDASFGFDSLRYGYSYTPIAGSSLLLTGSATVQPFRGQIAGRTRVDAAHYFHIAGQSSFLVRASVGSSYGSVLQRDFYLSSFDTLRGVNIGDTYFLVGRYFYYSNAEFLVPLNGIIRVFPFSNLEAVAGFDFGGVAPTLTSYFDRRVLDGVLGVNLALGALIFRLHFARPINIGATFVPADGWVTNFSIRIAGFDFGNALKAQPASLNRPGALSPAMVR